MHTCAVFDEGKKKPAIPVWERAGSGAEDRIRTDDLFITNELLYQLSYFGDDNSHG